MLEDQFKTACLRSVDAFRDGLTGQTFDAWLYLYIGRALAAAGLVDEASAALETAARIDSSIFAQPSIVEELAAEMPESEIPVPEPPEPAPKVATEPITDEEVEQFGALLRKTSWTPDDLLDDPD